MADYGRNLRFGFFPVPHADPAQALRLSVLADELGLDCVGVQDHPSNPQFMDSWTLISAIAMRTSRISVFADVAQLPLRPPSVLAKAHASLDLLTGGRVELGLGSGAFADAVAAMGGPRWTAGDGVRAMEEAIQVIRLMWSGERSVEFSGRYYHLSVEEPGPVPAHRIGIWLGVNGPRALALTGRLADGWIPGMFPYLKPEQLAPMAARVDEAARAAGRDPGSIRRIWNISGTITPRPTGNLFNDSVEGWAQSLADVSLEHGFDTYLLFEGKDAEAQLRTFALEVVPLTRHLVDQQRRAMAAAGETTA